MTALFYLYSLSQMILDIGYVIHIVSHGHSTGLVLVFKKHDEVDHGRSRS